MKSSKEVQTRKWFLDIATNLNKLNFINAGVEFREACFIFKKKVSTIIEEKRKEIFALPPDVIKSLDEYNTKIFEGGQPFAVLNAKNEIAMENNTYDIEPSKVNLWLEKKAEIDKKYEDTLKVVNKNKLEENEWLNKKISINIKKVEHISSMPSLSDNQEAYAREHQSVNKNIAFNVIINALCDEQVSIEADDGKEIE